MKKYAIILTAVLLFAGVLLSCGTTGPGAARPIYTGVGNDASMLAALSQAKMDAVRNAVIATIGAEREAANAEELARILYNTNNPNAYVLPDTMEELRRDRIDGAFVYEIRIEVNMEAVRNVLSARGLMGEGEPEVATTTESAATTTTTTTETASAVNGTAETPADLEATNEDFGGELTPEQTSFIRRYVDTMTYMVFFDPETTRNPDLMRTAVAKANEYLGTEGMSAVDASRVEQLRSERELVYEGSTGQELSVIQWVAESLDADVYIQIDEVDVRGESAGRNHFGTTNLNLRMFETSTGQMLGSQTVRSQRTLSTASQADALVNAINSSVWMAMPSVVDQCRNYMVQALRQGIRYEMVIQNTPDPRVVSAFRRALSRRPEIRNLETVSQSADETVYHVFLLGSIESLEDLVYDVCENVEGMEGIMQTLTRGRSITFDSGM